MFRPLCDTQRRFKILLRFGTTSLSVAILLIQTTNGFAADHDSNLVHRWVYLAANMQGEGEPAHALAILRRAKAAGYNGVLMADYKFNVLDRVVDRYFKNMAEFRKTADELDMEIIPAVAGFGYSNGILAHNPNLAEEIPVKQQPLRVVNGKAIVNSELQTPIPGGDFEIAKGDSAVGWDYQDGPGTLSFIDSGEKHSGKASIRFENLSTIEPKNGLGRLIRKVKGKAWRQYHASVWIKTAGFERSNEVRVMAISPDGRTLSHSHVGVKPTQDWTQHHAVFNSLGSDDFTFYCGVWGGTTGRIWFDDVKLEEVAFVNLIRRDDCPLVVTGDNAQQFEEGKDFARLVDPRMGNVPWEGEYEVFHEPPSLTLLPGGKITEGSKLKVSYFHTATIYEGQVAAALNHPAVFKIVEEQIRGVNKLLAPKSYMLSHDEIRIANWGAAARGDQRSPGQALADNMRQTIKLTRSITPNARLCTWNDMFDPHHNAVDGPYYLVNGSWKGSWEGLDPSITILNWNHGNADQSLAFFEKLGCPQILAGYYDGDPKAIIPWLQKAKDVKTLRGVMYTTWANKYDDLEAFAKAAWGN